MRAQMKHLLLSLAAFAAASEPDPAEQECLMSLLTLDPPLDVSQPQHYGNWFDDESHLTLSQAGTYIVITEYMYIGLSNSPFVDVVRRRGGVGLDRRRRRWQERGGGGGGVWRCWGGRGGGKGGGGEGGGGGGGGMWRWR